MMVIISYKNGLMHPYVINTPLLTLYYTNMFGRKALSSWSTTDTFSRPDQQNMCQ